MSNRVVPREPVDIDEVITRFPTVRQSLLSSMDDCALSAFFSLEHANGWSTSAQARGTLLHRAYAEILRTMQRHGHQTMPASEGLEILIEVLRQQDVPARDIVRVPLRQIPELRMGVVKFCKDNAFSTDKIVAIEERLEAPIRYQRADGRWVVRRFTGQLDVLLFAPPDGATVIDWKTGWGLPPKPVDARQEFDDEELKGLSYLGYFQQRAYGFLVMTNYRNVNSMSLREFFPYKTVARKATLHRHQLPQVEQELGLLIEAFDNAIMQGAPDLEADEHGRVDIEALGYWQPRPGKHCSYCTRPTACPIPDDVRVAAGGAPATAEHAQRWAARLQIAEAIRKIAIDGLKGYVEEGGAPVPVRWSKGRRVIGWYETKGGRRFGFFTPDESDRGGHADVDEQLREAMQASTQRARAERDAVRPRKRSTPRKVKA